MGALRNETFSNWYEMLGSDTIQVKINGFKTISLLDKVGNNHPVKLSKTVALRNILQFFISITMSD